MESIPPEMVEMVAQHLAPEDLARCCAVSRSWREMFNRDWVWKMHCDPAMEESLRTTPSVIKPAFVIPGSVPGSTLTPIGKWRVAFMREQHLWGNWKKNLFKKGYFPGRRVRRCVVKDMFLTDTLLVAWSSKRIEIWDVSSIRAVLFAKTNPSVVVKRWYSCSVVGGRMLILRQEVSVQVFLVDIVNKCIDLKHEIPLGPIKPYNLGSWGYELPGDFFVIQKISVVGSIVFGVTGGDSNRELAIYDLEKGEKIKEDRIPVGDEYTEIFGMKTFPLSEDILVLVQSIDELVTYIYSPKKLRFLSGPIVVGSVDHIDDCAINKHYVALGGDPFLVIVDYLTSEVVLKYEGQKHLKLHPLAYNDSFIFFDNRDGKRTIQMFSLTNKTITTTYEYVAHLSLYDVNTFRYHMVNSKFVIFYEIDTDVVAVATLKFSGKSLKPFDFLYSGPYDRVNNSFTRGQTFKGRVHTIYHYW